MVEGIYRCTHDWHGNSTIDVTVRAKETGKSYILELISDNSRFPDGHITAMFKGGNRVVCPKFRGPHAIESGGKWFVIYPFRNGVPFSFDLNDHGEPYDD